MTGATGPPRFAHPPGPAGGNGSAIRRRLIGVDVARGIALIGMMAIHVLPAWTEEIEPTFTWSVFSGTSAALFALLAGVSLAFISGGRSPHHGRAMTATRASVAVRAALIAGVGLLIAYADPPAAIILSYYGVLFLLAVPLLRLSARALALAALAFAVIGPVVTQALRDVLPDLDGYDPTFTTLFTEPGTFLSVVLFTGSYPALPWMTYLCAGMAIGRLDLGAKQTSARLLFGGAVLALGSWLLSTILLGPLGGLSRLQEATPWLNEQDISQFLTWGPPPQLPTTSWWWLTIISPYSSTPFEILHTLGIAAAALGAMLLLCRAAAPALQPLAAAGAMTFTLYSAHLLVLATGFLADAPWGSFFLQVPAAVVFAVLWSRTKGQGPLEHTVTRATSRVRQRISAGPR